MNKSDLAINIRKVVYRNLAKLDRSLLPKQDQLIVLCYHSFDNRDWRFAVLPDIFAEQMKYLLASYQHTSLGDIYRMIKSKTSTKKPFFAVTIDDGYASVWQIRDICKKLGVRPTLFVLSQPERANRQEMKTDEKLLTINQIKELKRDGWEIGCHSATHANFSNLSNTRARQEIILAKKELEKELGSMVDYFSYPLGRFNQAVMEQIAKSNYKLALTMGDGKITAETNPYMIPRIGVDGSHEFADFCSLFSPAVMLVRRLIRSSPLGGLYEKTI